MLEASQIEHADAAICTTADENVNTVRTETNVVNLLVVRNQLRLCCQGRNVPDGTRGINTRSDDQAGGNCVPVKRGNRGRMLRRFGI